MSDKVWLGVIHLDLNYSFGYEYSVNNLQYYIPCVGTYMINSRYNEIPLSVQKS